MIRTGAALIALALPAAAAAQPPDAAEAGDAGEADRQAEPAPARPTTPGRAAIEAAIPKRRGFGWDAEIDLGLRLAETGDADADLLMGRLQAGVLYVTEPWVFAAGATGEIGGLADAGLGGQLSITHLRTGVWGHAGASWTTGDPMTSIAAGVTLAGVEWQRQIGDDATGDAFLLHLRIPIGTTAFLLTHTPE